MKMLSFKSMSVRISDALGLAVLSKEFMRYCDMYICFLFFFNMNNIFVSTFLYKVTNDYRVVMYYNIWLYVAQAIATFLGVMSIKKRSIFTSTRMGILFHSVVYLAFIIFGEKLAGFYPLIAIFFALGGGFYWLAESVYFTSYTTDRHRDVAVSYTNLWGSISSIAVPTFAGMLVSLFSGFTGYRVLFGIGFTLTLICVYLSTKLDPVDRIDTSKPRFGEAFKEVFKIKAERAVVGASIMRGTRDGVFSFILSIMLFEMLQNEAYIGLNAFISGVAALVSAWLYGKLVKPGNRGYWMKIAVTVMVAVTALVLLKVNAITVILLSLFSNLLGNFMVNPVFMYGYVMVQTVPQADEKRLESQTMIQVFLYVGRVIGIVATLIMLSLGWGYIIPLGILTLLQYVTVWLTRVAKREFERIEAGGQAG